MSGNPDGRRAELDGLRAIAVSAVIAFHCLTFPLNWHTPLGYLARVPASGWGGVDVFFVLSGFLVGGILLDGRGQPGQMRRFFIRRSMRIVPLYIIAVISFYVVPLLLPESAPWQWLFAGGLPWWSYATLTQNFTFPLLGHGALYLGPTWSLAVEMQIYLLLGLSLTRLPPRLILPIMIAGVVTAEATRVLFVATGHSEFGYFMLPARIDGACMGVIIAIAARSEAARRNIRRWRLLIWLATMALFAGVVASGAVGHSIGSAAADTYTHLALALASAGTIVTLTVVPEGKINSLLRSAPLVGIGTISYGIYLIHVPIIGLAHVLMGQTSLSTHDLSSTLATAIGVVTTIGLAALSWRWFERPLIALSHRLTRSPSSPTTQLRPIESTEIPRSQQ